MLEKFVGELGLRAIWIFATDERLDTSLALLFSDY